MVKKARKDIEQAFLASNDSETVYDAFLALLPTEDQCFETVNSKKPMKFVSKLKDIGSSSRVITEAVSEYAGAKLMRMRCEKRRFPRDRLVRMDHNLISIYDSVNDSLTTKDLKPEDEQQRGRELLDKCKERSANVKLPGFTIDVGIAKGELQCIANGEGYEKRDITWKRQ